MLVRTVKIGELIAIGEDVEVVIIRRKGSRYSLGIRVPKQMSVEHRNRLDSTDLEDVDTDSAGPQDVDPLC